MDKSADYAKFHRGYLELLRLNFPFTKQELKRAYRIKEDAFLKWSEEQKIKSTSFARLFSIK